MFTKKCTTGGSPTYKISTNVVPTYIILKGSTLQSHHFLAVGEMNSVEEECIGLLSFLFTNNHKITPNRRPINPNESQNSHTANITSDTQLTPNKIPNGFQTMDL